MFGIQPRIIRNVKKQTNMTHNQEKNRQIEAERKNDRIKVLADKDLKTAIVNMLHMLNNMEWIMNMMRNDNNKKRNI